MAATYRTSAAGGGTSGSGDRTCTITPAVGDHFTVFCAATGNTNTTPTCSDNNGGTYNLVDAALFNASASAGSVFVRTASLPNTTSTVVTVATGSNTSAEIVVVAYSGMSRFGTASIRSKGNQANQAASTTPAPTLNQAALTTNAVIGAVCNGSNPAALTPTGFWNERQDVGQSTPSVGLEVQTHDSAFTGTTVTWGGTSPTAFASFVIELDGSANVYTLTADQGSYTMTGNTAGLLRALKMAAAQGTYTMTGNAANLTYGKTLIADTGTYVITGYDARRQVSRVAGTGTYTIVGNDAALRYGNNMGAETGVYLLNGNAAVLTGPGGVRDGGISLRLGLSLT